MVAPALSPGPVRALSAQELGISTAPLGASADGLLSELMGEDEKLNVQLAPNDPVAAQVENALKEGFAGVILFGPPGTGKSWYAGQIAAKLADSDPARVRFLQFHPSYQYEDFVEGYVPDGEGGFRLQAKHFLEMVDMAGSVHPKPCFIVIDELSRCDPSRVFGEALTYIETSKRDIDFSLASGTVTSIPSNLFVIATMNPWDRNVDEVDAAFERRFAKIEMPPDSTAVEVFLVRNKCEAALVARVLAFFKAVNSHPNPFCKVGHAYFRSVKDLATLENLWRYQLKHHLERAFRLDQPEYLRIQKLWERVVAPLQNAGPGEGVANAAVAVPPGPDAGVLGAAVAAPGQGAAGVIVNEKLG